MKLCWIDVSYHNGKIDWKKLKPEIDFAIIRAGYGAGNIDKQANNNINGCIKNNIPYGFYWFSYAYTTEMAIKEAKYLIDFIGDRKPEYPIYFDFEYDSIKFAQRNGVKITKDLLHKITVAFCETLENAGYYVGVYSNKDYIINMFKPDIFKKYDLWYAYWNDNCDTNVKMWQCSDSTIINGVNGVVDYNYCYFNYPELIKKCGLNNHIKQVYNLDEIVCECLGGLWGNGKDRVKQLTDNGINYKDVQSRINEYYKVATDVIKGLYGNGKKRKAKLEKLGYNYEVVKHIVNEKVGK